MYRGELAKCADLLAFQLGKAGARSFLRGTFPHHPWDWYIYLHECLIFMVNVGKYTIHGWYGIVWCLLFFGGAQGKGGQKIQVFSFEEGGVRESERS